METLLAGWAAVDGELAVGGVVVAAVIFACGYLLGHRRGRLSRRWFSQDKRLTRA